MQLCEFTRRKMHRSSDLFSNQAMFALQAVVATHTRAPRNQADTNVGRQMHHRAQELLQAGAAGKWQRQHLAAIGGKLFLALSCAG